MLMAQYNKKLELFSVFSLLRKKLPVGHRHPCGVALGVPVADGATLGMTRIKQRIFSYIPA